MTRHDFVAKATAVNTKRFADAGVDRQATIQHALIQAVVKAVVPGIQNRKNIEPVMVKARTAALRALREYRFPLGWTQGLK